MANTKKLKLLNNIQFVYGLALARLELHSFNSDLKITNDFRKFGLQDDGNFETLKRRLAYFKTINGDYSDYYYLQKYNQTKLVNQYLTH